MNVGIGSMLHYLSGESENYADKYYGKKISKAVLQENHLVIDFEYGVTIDIFDDGQSCCEHRYMSTDDDVSWLNGKVLIKVEVKYADTVEDEYGKHEISFLEIMTDQGCVAFANHNDHNGFYGGFWLTIRESSQ